MSCLRLIPFPVIGLIFDKLGEDDLHTFAVTSKTSLRYIYAYKKRLQRVSMAKFNAIKCFRRLFGKVCADCSTYNHKYSNISKVCFCRKCGHDNEPHFFVDIPDEALQALKKYASEYNNRLTNAKQSIIEHLLQDKSISEVLYTYIDVSSEVIAPNFNIPGMELELMNGHITKDCLTNSTKYSFVFNDGTFKIRFKDARPQAEHYHRWDSDKYGIGSSYNIDRRQDHSLCYECDKKRLIENVFNTVDIRGTRHINIHDYKHSGLFNL